MPTAGAPAPATPGRATASSRSMWMPIWWTAVRQALMSQRRAQVPAVHCAGEDESKSAGESTAVRQPRTPATAPQRRCSVRHAAVHRKHPRNMLKIRALPSLDQSRQFRGIERAGVLPLCHWRADPFREKRLEAVKHRGGPIEESTNIMPMIDDGCKVISL